ncbi:hypothetical protein ACFIQF_13230 [Comamonas sp. J-3]|uniref:hypothetical protein n=1 Tax=Comamonas trifloxystrobinivorans TaxID=3350256 RepID=UPI00372837A0
MTLKITVDSLDSVPENVRDLYKEVDGKFRLDLEGYEDPAGLKSALDKERLAAKEAGKQAKAWSALGKTPEEIQELLQRLETDEDAKLIAAGKMDEVVQKRTERMQAEHTKKLQAEAEGRTKAEAKAAKLADRALNAVLRDAAAAAGALPEALDDVVRRGSGLWVLSDDGDVVAMNGDQVVLGKDGKAPLSPKEWAESIRDSAPYFWPATRGSGAPGSSGGAANNSGNFGGGKADRLAAIKKLTSKS